MRKLLVGLGVAVVLIIAAAVFIPIVVPVTAYEGRLVTIVKQVTGRDFRIAGPVKLSLLPAVEIDANDVSLGNMADARSPDMVRLKQLRMRLQIWPLLHGSVVVSRLVLVEPAIALEVDRAGNPNWVFRAPEAPPAPSPLAAEKPPTAGGSLGISSLTLAEVRLVDGKISYIDQRTGEGQRIGNLDMTLSLHSLPSPLSAHGSALWRSERVTFALNIDQPRALLVGGESQAGIKLAAAPITLDFSGRVAGLPSANLAGVIELKTQSVRQLAAWMGSPITFSGSGFGPLTIRGAITTAGAKTSLSDANFSLDAINAKGSIAIDRAGARPAVTGKLDVDKLDLNPYLPPETAPTVQPVAAADPVPAPSPAARSDRDDLSIDASPLKIADLDVNIDLKLGSAAYRKFQIGPSMVGIRVKDGRLTADLSRMELYRGSGHGEITLDGSSATPRVGLTIALAQVQIDPLAQAVIADNRLTGIGNLDLAITARGGSRRELISTLSGNARLSLANGQIEGVNLPALAESAAKIERDIIRTLDITDTLNLLAHGQINKVGPLALLENAARALVGGGNASNFATLTATGTITNGLVRNNDLQVRLGGVPMTGAGTVDLRTSMVDYRVSVRVGEGINVPIQVSGAWDNLNYRPDLAAVLMQTPRNVLDALKSAGGSVGKGLEGVGQGAVGVLKGIFGK